MILCTTFGMNDELYLVRIKTVLKSNSASPALHVNRLLPIQHPNQHAPCRRSLSSWRTFPRKAHSSWSTASGSRPVALCACRAGHTCCRRAAAVSTRRPSRAVSARCETENNLFKNALGQNARTE